MNDHAPRGVEGSRSLPPRTQLTIVGVGALVAVFILFGLPMLGQIFAPKPPPAPPAPPAGTFQATDAQWATLSFAPVQYSTFQGETQTDGRIATDDDRTTQVFSPYSGRVTRVFAKAGDHVQAGQPLFAVRASEFIQARSDLVTAQSALATAKAQLKVAQAAEARQTELLKSGGAAQKDVQQSEVDLTTAQAGLRTAEIGVTSVEDRMRMLGADGAPAGGAKSGETIVTSPISGVVTLRAIGVGQNIGSVTNGGVNPAFTVSDLSVVWLIGNLREDDIRKAAVGQPVRVEVTALPGRVFDARVDFVSPTIDPVSRRAVVRARIDNPEGLLKPEMFATFTLLTDGGVSAVVVPESAVIFEGDTARVWVAHKGQNLELRRITAGGTRNGMVEVLGGLKAGETIVTSGAVFIDRAASPD
jgi:cobalt-zinc-cadmium efflux system membrane fusion protein